MDKDVTQVMEGVVAGKVIQSVMRKYVDPMLAPSLLYSPTQYWVDLKAAGYLLQATEATQSDEQIGQKIMAEGGYTFLGFKVSGTGGNLLGTNKLTANKFTYMAAIGQKKAAYLMPSVWGTGLVGIIGVADGMYGFLGLDKYKLAVTAMGASLVGDAAARGLGVDGITAAPSGFDIDSTKPPMQYLDQSAVQNLQKLSSENQRLHQEIAQLRAAQPPRGMPPGIPSYSVTAQQPVVQVTEILPQRGAQPIKDRSGILTGAIQKATAESVRHQTGLVTLHGGR